MADSQGRREPRSWEKAGLNDWELWRWRRGGRKVQCHGNQERRQLQGGGVERCQVLAEVEEKKDSSEEPADLLIRRPAAVSSSREGRQV